MRDDSEVLGPIRDAKGAVVAYESGSETTEERELRNAEAEMMTRGALAEAERLGPQHPRIAECLTVLGFILNWQWTSLSVVFAVCDGKSSPRDS